MHLKGHIFVRKAFYAECRYCKITISTYWLDHPGETHRLYLDRCRGTGSLIHKL